MGGSIRIPSACCGVIGLRPSPGRVPTDQPDVTHLAVPGPMARSAVDLRIAFEFLIGEIAPDPRDRPLSIVAIDQSPLPVSAAARSAVDRAASALEAAGHHVVSGREWLPEPVARAYQRVRPVTMSTTPGEPAEYGPDVAPLIQEGRRTSATDFLAALEQGVAAAGFVHERMHGHDLILTPTMPSVARPIDEVPAFLSEGWVELTQFVLPVSFAGLPAISVPAGLDDGLPVGVQLVGSPRREWLLLDVAAQIEQSPGFGFQRPPGYD
jgi:Asp-tRNA(Asn)/Glu-tRNA(Gln) amidotransferase A subunit family amidase